MNKTIKKLWLRALRSGKYKQGTYELRTKDNKYCCLGVLSDLYGKEHKEKWNKDSLGDYEFKGYDCDLPPKVRNWSGIKSSCGNFKEEKIKTKTKINQGSLSEMNDEGGTFKQIADFIEKHF